MNGSKLCRIAVFAVVLAHASSGFGQEKPVDEIRTPGSDVLAVYFPSFFSNNGCALFDNYYVRAGVTNLITTGPNLNLYFGYNHHIGQDEVIPGTLSEITSVKTLLQSNDGIYGEINFSFLDFFQVYSTFDYVQNRLVAHEVSYADYNFDKTVVGMNAAFDCRHSSWETWHEGTTFKYPEKGFLFSLGTNYNSFSSDYFTGFGYFTLVGRYNQLVQLSDFLVVSFDASAETLLQKQNKRISRIKTNVIGAYNLPGDYAADGSIELRFLNKGGLFVETPDILFLTKFLLKLSPGFVVGYNLGAAGDMELTTINFVHSGYVSPLVAVRINGLLQAVLRFDISLSTSNVFNLVLSFNFGMMPEKPSTFFRTTF